MNTNMVISSIRLQDFQKHTRLDLDGLQPGINLFTAPNGWGKSSIARAIRAACLETHKTGTVKYLCPNNNPGAGPSVEIDFSFGDKSFGLKKRFLKTPRASLTISETGKPSQALESKEAEEYLAEMLGHDMAGKGSKPSDHGIPGLLWIEQGKTNHFVEAIGNAYDKVQSVLSSAMGEVASSAGDKILESIVAEMDAMVTTRGAKAGSEYANSIGQLEQITEQCALLAGKIAEYRQQVDELAVIRDAYLSTERERPWEEMEGRLAAIRIKLEALDGMQKEKDIVADDIKNLKRHLGLLQEKDARMDGEKNDLLARKKNILERTKEIDQLLEQKRGLAGQIDAATQALADALAVLDKARDREQIADIDGQIAAAQKQLDAIQSAKARIAGVEAELQAKQATARDSYIDESAVERLRVVRRTIDDIKIQQQALATRVNITPDAGRAWVGLGKQSSAAEALVVVERSVFTLDGWGTISIDPGAEDLGEMVAKERAASNEMQDILKALGVATAAEAEARLLAYQSVAADIAGLEKAIATGGGNSSALEVDEQSVADRLGRLAAKRKSLPATVDIPEGITVGSAQDLVATREAELALIAAGVKNIDEALLRAEAAQKHESEESDAIAARIDGEAWQQELGKNRAAMAETAGQLDMRVARSGDIEAAIAAEMPDVLKQDMVRLQTSISSLLDAQNDRNTRINRLEAVLYDAGQHNSDERLAELTAEKERLERRIAQMKVRADALAYLTRLLQESRAKTLQKIQAPLQKHISRYLKMLFPAAVMELNEQLEPVAVKFQQTGEAQSLSQLSYGTVEQISLICRLAYADLLRESGKPTVIMLDDALVHTDDRRVEDMKRVIFDAATRHQILMFSCHPGTWDDLGGKHFRLGEA